MDSGKAPPIYDGGDQPTAPVEGIPIGPPGYNDQFKSSLNAPPSAPQFDGDTPGEWSSGLCGCFSDVENCFTTLCCPCITVGKNAEIIDRGATSCATAGALYAVIMMLSCCGFIFLCGYRSKLRRQYMLPYSPCPDCLVHFFCSCCALCQEYRELKTRGWDMDLGWHGNIELQHRAMTRAPVVEEGMTKY